MLCVNLWGHCQTRVLSRISVLNLSCQPRPITAAPPGGMGAAAHHHRQNHQRGREPDPDAWRQGHQPGAAVRVPRLLQPLWQGQGPSSALTGYLLHLLCYPVIKPHSITEYWAFRLAVKPEEKPCFCFMCWSKNYKYEAFNDFYHYIYNTWWCRPAMMHQASYVFVCVEYSR